MSTDESDQVIQRRANLQELRALGVDPYPRRFEHGVPIGAIVTDHGVKTAPFYVLRYTAMPSILAELSFISNSSDEKLLRASSYRQKMAEALFEGIRNYLNSAQVASVAPSVKADGAPCFSATSVSVVPLLTVNARSASVARR